MQRFTITVTPENSLHLRSAGAFTKLCESFESTIHVHCGDMKANVDSILSLMFLFTVEGNELTFEISGEDEVEASQKLLSFLEMGS